MNILIAFFKKRKMIRLLGIAVEHLNHYKFRGFLDYFYLLYKDNKITKHEQHLLAKYIDKHKPAHYNYEFSWPECTTTVCQRRLEQLRCELTGEPYKKELSDLLYLVLSDLIDRHINGSPYVALCIITSSLYSRGTITKEELVEVIKHIHANRPPEAKYVRICEDTGLCTHYFWYPHDYESRYKFMLDLLRKSWLV